VTDLVRTVSADRVRENRVTPRVARPSFNAPLFDGADLRLERLSGALRHLPPWRRISNRGEQKASSASVDFPSRISRFANEKSTFGDDV
jgi:hypothetical protein